MVQKKKMNRKASVQDIIFAIVIFFALAIGFLIIHKVVGEVSTQLINTTVINESSDAVSAIQGGVTISNRLDYILMMVFIGFILAIIVTGWLIGGHPLFMVLYFIILVIGVAISAILSYVWEQVVSQPAFTTTVLSFPIANAILENLPVYATIISFIGIIVMFAKSYQQTD